MSIPQAGKKAPAFKLNNQDGEVIASKDLKGSYYVFYFYPKDNTPGCTTEAIDFSAMIKDFDKLNCKVFGVSPDSEKSHCRFIEKKDLKVQLLADPEHAIIEKYGAWQLKKFMGREYMGVVRSTWLINDEGKIIKAWSPVKVKNHAQEVLDTLKEAQA